MFKKGNSFRYECCVSVVEDVKTKRGKYTFNMWLREVEERRRERKKRNDGMNDMEMNSPQ